MINHANISFAAKGLAVCGLTLVAGCAGGDRGFSNRDMDRFVTVLIAQDCTVTAENAAEVETTTGFSKEKLGKITRYLRGKNLIAMTGDFDGMTLINEGCP